MWKWINRYKKWLNGRDIKPNWKINLSGPRWHCNLSPPVVTGLNLLLPPYKHLFYKDWRLSRRQNDIRVDVAYSRKRAFLTRPNPYHIQYAVLLTVNIRRLLQRKNFLYNSASAERPKICDDKLIACWTRPLNIIIDKIHTERDM